MVVSIPLVLVVILRSTPASNTAFQCAREDLPTAWVGGGTGLCRSTLGSARRGPAHRPVCQPSCEPAERGKGTKLAVGCPRPSRPTQRIWRSKMRPSRPFWISSTSRAGRRATITAPPADLTKARKIHSAKIIALSMDRACRTTVRPQCMPGSTDKPQRTPRCLPMELQR